MAEQHSAEGASSGGVSVSTVELKIKTLDSQIYNFHVDKNMLVSSFKGKIADQIGIPVGQQRLIFRGKVLKDDHVLSEYHVENGDTLHLVERQQTQPPAPTGTGNTDTSVNSEAQGNDGNPGAPRNRIGHIAHSVVLGTFNVGEQGEGAVPDLTRVIGAVLNSLGVGNQNTPNAATATATAAALNTVPQNASDPQGGDAEQGRGSAAVPSQAGPQAQFSQPFLNQPFPMPFTGASPAPSSNLPIPDSLSTLSEFMSRLEEVLSQNGYQLTPPIVPADQSAAAELPSNARGLPTPETLGLVLRQTQRLLSGLGSAALSHIAGRLEQEGGSTDNSVRSQIQTESVQVGLAMQHLGALLLELGRTILTLRMGQSPAEGVVNAGPAVYISQSGPNPIMVQPFPHQTSPLFNPPVGFPPNTGSLSPVGIIGSAPRHINIHIHAGTSLAPLVSAVGATATGSEVAQGERNGGTASGGSGPTRVFPVRNVIAAAVPRSASVAVSSAPNVSQPIGGVSASQPNESTSLSSAISQVNSQIRNFLENMPTDSASLSGQQGNSSVPHSSFGSTVATATSRSLLSEDSRDAAGPQSQGDLTTRQEDAAIDVSQPADESICLGGSTPSFPGAEHGDIPDIKEAQKSSDIDDPSTGVTDVPLGLGGGLQPKKRGRQFKMLLNNGEGGTSGGPDLNQQARTSGQQVLQSLASQSIAGRMDSNDAARAQIEQGLGQAFTGTQQPVRGSDGQLDVSGMMSQLLESPALNGLLSGVAQQTGVGSPDAFRNMLQQFTQNPAMRNTVNQLAQQVDREEFRHMFSGMGTGQEGGLDFSTMIQQMMPVVSQVLGGGSVEREQMQSVVPDLQPQSDNRRLSDGDRSLGLPSQDDLQAVVQRIAIQNSPQDVFRAVVQCAAEHSRTADGELVDGLCENDDLADLFLEILYRDLRDQLQEDAAASGGSS